MKMSYELYTQEKIVNHQENHSPTKFMYSFARARRFPPLDRRGFSDSLYNFPKFGNAQKVSIGYGDKTDFTKKRLVTEIVGIKRDFDKDSKTRGISYTFGVGRDKYGKVVCPGYKYIDKNVPGPGKYNSFLNTMGNMGSPAYTMRPKCGDTDWLNKLMDNPGPGAYNSIVKININGKYPMSRIKNVNTRNFGIDRIDRFSNYRCKKYILLIQIFLIIDNHIPGPNAYKDHSLIGCNIADSRYKSPCFVSLSRKFKEKDLNAGNPGPGSYIRFSEFGILAPKKDKDKEKKEDEKKDEENKNENTNEGGEENAQPTNEEKNENNNQNNQENENNNQNNQENENNNENSLENNNQNNQENEKNNNEDLKNDENEVQKILKY